MGTNVAQQITDALKLKEVMEFYGIKFNSRGFASCPFHNEKTPSLSIKKEHYKCFGCGAYGGIIDFVMNYFGLPFMQAVMKLNSDFHIGLAEDKPDYRTRRRMAEEAKINAAYEKYRDELHQNYLTLCQVHAILFRRLCDGETWLEDITDRLRTLLETFDDEEARAWETILKSTQEKNS